MKCPESLVFAEYLLCIIFDWCANQHHKNNNIYCLSEYLHNTYVYMIAVYLNRRTTSKLCPTNAIMINDHQMDFANKSRLRNTPYIYMRRVIYLTCGWLLFSAVRWFRSHISAVQAQPRLHRIYIPNRKPILAICIMNSLRETYIYVLGASAIYFTSRLTAPRISWVCFTVRVN